MIVAPQTSFDVGGSTSGGAWGCDQRFTGSRVSKSFPYALALSARRKAPSFAVDCGFTGACSANTGIAPVNNVAASNTAFCMATSPIS